MYICEIRDVKLTSWFREAKAVPATELERLEQVAFADRRPGPLLGILLLLL